MLRPDPYIPKGASTVLRVLDLGNLVQLPAPRLLRGLRLRATDKHYSLCAITHLQVNKLKKIFNMEDHALSTEISCQEYAGANKGQIYTRPDVVDFMLTVIGLHEGIELKNIRVLEPACGEGEFVMAIANRLIGGRKKKPETGQLIGKILAVDLVGGSIEIAKKNVAHLLDKFGYTNEEKTILLNDWFLQGDFLLEDINYNFSHIIGNPPYVRVESMPKSLLLEYRRMFATMTDRSDLYIPFFEKSLSLLENGGKLSFICTDRWMKNTYGKSLRGFISENYSLELLYDLYGAKVFDTEVMTYPAITQIVKGLGDSTVLVTKASFAHNDAIEALKAIAGNPSKFKVRKGIVEGNKPWLTGSIEEKALIRKLERNHPTLEETGCKVYIGAATGANKIYVVDIDSVDIEKSQLLPMITASELKSGKIHWQGKYIINTYDTKGIINLNEYPRLAQYLNGHKEQLCQRHVAKIDPLKWFKTIDRVYEERVGLEKLLIPDISSDPVVIYDEGRFHPNNSIYYISSKEWNLNALRVVLLSNITKLFISSYSTKIANGYFRFQAQHLRKLRLPLWSQIAEELKVAMIEAGKSDDKAKFTELTCKMYGLSTKDILTIGE